VIAYAVSAYHRFALTTAGPEDFLAERGVIVSRNAVRLWVNRLAFISPDAFDEIGKSPTTNGIWTKPLNISIT